MNISRHAPSTKSLGDESCSNIIEPEKDSKQNTLVGLKTIQQQQWQQQQWQQQPPSQHWKGLTVQTILYNIRKTAGIKQLFTQMGLNLKVLHIGAKLWEILGFAISSSNTPAKILPYKLNVHLSLWVGLGSGPLVFRAQRLPMEDCMYHSMQC